MLNKFNFLNKLILKTSFCLVLSFFSLGFLSAVKNSLINSDYIDSLRETTKFRAKLDERKSLSRMRPKIRRRFEKRGKLLQGLKDARDNSKKDIFANMSKQELAWLEEKIKSVTASNAASKDEKELDELEELNQLKEQFSDCDKAVDSGDKDKIERLIKELEKDVELDEKELKYINVVLSGGSWGDIFLRGIAGPKNWKMIEDQKVENIWEGLGKGALLRIAVSTGDAIGVIIDRYVQTFFDSTLGRVESFVSFLNRAVFHSSCRPFTTEELEYWQKLVSNDFREIEMMIKNAEKLDSRGKADILREYEAEQETETQTLNLWQDFVEDHAFTYEELAQEIELRKGYYKKEANGFGIVNCADRVINKLLKVRVWLLSVKSLRDFANIPEAKSIIPAMRKSIDNYFANLANQVRPLVSKKTTKLDFGESSFSKKDHWGNDFGEGSSYPGYMTE